LAFAAQEPIDKYRRRVGMRRLCRPPRQPKAGEATAPSFKCVTLMGCRPLCIAPPACWAKAKGISWPTTPPVADSSW
jgi:hypothetical protein